MSEESSEKSALVPRRRFPEFLDFGGWQVAQLSQALKFQPGFPFPSTGFNSEGVGLRLIRNRDLRSDENPVHFSGPYNGDFVVGDGDILVGMDGDFTPCVWRKGNALLNQRVGRVLPKEGSDQRFLFYFLSVHLKAIEDTTARTTVKHLSHSDVERICEPFPKKAEQQKIADCLSSLDELITAETQKLATLKTHKKGLMQQLFPREGETVPRLRFPEFREAPEWGKAALQELVTTVSPPSKIQSSSYLLQGQFPIIDQSQETICGWTNDESAVISESLPLIVFGDHTCALKFVESPFAQGADGIKILKAKTAISAEFLFHSLNHRPQVMEDYKRHFSILKERVVFYPDIESGEQQRIADCLSSLDDLITAQSQIIDALKTHKRGLMQQLFPVLDEVHA